MPLNVDGNRLTGVYLGAAVGDALGAGYEFGPPLPETQIPVMKGGNGFAPGEWTDDTAQLIAIAMVVAGRIDPASPSGLEAIARNFLDWYDSPARLKDIGIHTSQVLGTVASVRPPGIADRMTAAAVAKEASQPGSSGGNGALMRTAPIALAYLGDAGPFRTAKAAMTVAELTHADQLSSEACAVWCLAIRNALLAPKPGDLVHIVQQTKSDLVLVFSTDRYNIWLAYLDEAAAHPAVTFTKNGWSVHALQAALSVVVRTPIPCLNPESGTHPMDHLRLAVQNAVRVGNDTDTVACIAGALLGAMWGVDAIPQDWRAGIKGWPYPEAISAESALIDLAGRLLD